MRVCQPPGGVRAGNGATGVEQRLTLMAACTCALGLIACSFAGSFTAPTHATHSASARRMRFIGGARAIVSLERIKLCWIDNSSRSSRSSRRSSK